MVDAGSQGSQEGRRGGGGRGQVADGRGGSHDRRQGLGESPFFFVCFLSFFWDLELPRPESMYLLTDLGSPPLALSPPRTQKFKTQRKR